MRSTDAISGTITVVKTVTGEIEEGTDYASSKAKRKGVAGAAFSVKSLSPEARQAGTKKPAHARWNKEDEKMSDPVADPLAGLLFGRDTELVNLKLCRGDSPDVSEAELRNETHFALTQVAFGRCDTHSDFPENKNAKRINVTELSGI